MPVVTAAVLAVGAAIATTTAATVATAVVAVSTAVGVAGLAVGAVGAITGNKDLQFAGKIMGYVGLAGGLAGGVIGGVGAVAGESGMSFAQGFGDAFAGASQHLSNAWDKGVGSWFTGGESVAKGASGNVGSIADDVAANAAAPKTMSSPGNGMAAFPEAENPGISTVVPGNGVTSVTPAAGAPAPAAPITTGVGTPGVSSIATPGAPTVAGNAGGNAAATGGGLMDSFSNMPDWMKYSMMTTGAQGLTGLAGGYFQGKQAEATLGQQQLVNDRDQAQRQLLNSQGNQVPTLRFQTV